MKIQVGNKICNGGKEPIMIIVSEDEKKQIAKMHSSVIEFSEALSSVGVAGIKAGKKLKEIAVCYQEDEG